jgi:glycosyltransferase involved in cell wall biosynthesis
VRIAYLSLDPGIPVGGQSGAAVHVECVTSALAQAGHEVTVVAARLAESGRSTCPVVPIEIPAALRQGVKSVGALVRRALPEYRYDRDLRGLLLNATMVEPLASELTRLGADVVLERLSLFGMAGLDAARIQRIPHAIEMNAPLAAEAARYRGLTAEPLARTIEEKVLRGTDLIFTVSRSLEEHCQALGVPAGRLRTVSNGAHLGAFTPGLPGGERRRELGWTDGEVVIGFVGGLRPWHGGLDLAAAFIRLAASHPKARLLIVGDGPERGPMEALIADADLSDRAHFLGIVSHDAVPSYLASMDIAVAPYRPEDAFYFSPLKLFEYMAAGKPIVASALGQIEEVIADGVNGALVDPSDSDALVGGIGRLIDDGAMRQRLGSRARRSAEEHHAWSHKVAQIEAGLEEVVNRVRGSVVAAS